MEKVEFVYGEGSMEGVKMYTRLGVEHLAQKAWDNNGYGSRWNYPMSAEYLDGFSSGFIKAFEIYVFEPQNTELLSR